MKSGSSGRGIALLAVFGILMVSCGRSTPERAATTDDGAAAGVDETAAVDSDGRPEPVDQEPGGVGQDDTTVNQGVDTSLGISSDNILVGPSGFTIDLNRCPSDWEDTGGVTSEEVTLGTSWPFSGSLAAFGLTADGMENYFGYVNETEGGLGGREIKLVKKDDAYAPARVVTNIGELVQKDNVFAVATVAGTPGNLAIYDSLNEQCVPHMFAATGHPAWGDPNHHPWSTPSFLAYNTEAQIWGAYIEDQVETGDLAAPVDVAALVMNNDFGLAYKTEFEAVAERSPVIGTVTFELHDPAAPNVVNELTTLAATDADVAILMTTSVYCTQSFISVAQAAWEPALKLFSNTCAGIESFFLPAGDTGAGWRYAGHAKDTADPVWADDPFVATAREHLSKSGLDPDKSQYGNGWAYGWANATAMKVADELPGGLSRTNLLLATRQMHTKNPAYFDGVDWILDGAEDAYPTEAAAILEYQLDRGEEVGSYVIVSDIISAEGESGLCHFVDGACLNE